MFLTRIRFFWFLCSSFCKRVGVICANGAEQGLLNTIYRSYPNSKLASVLNTESGYKPWAYATL